MHPTSVLRICAAGVASAALALLAGPALAAPCEDLAKLQLHDTTIRSAAPVAAGAFAEGGEDLPAFCRVLATVKAAPDSAVEIEVWLPETDWKGVFHGVGNGGYAGSLSAGYPGMAAGVRRGYASATTDMGAAPASGLNGDPLIGHPQRWKDWGMLSTHEMTVVGKAIARAYYGKAATHAYYTGCSTGGQQGLIEALHYPTDYDGLLVGAPVVSRTWGHAAAVWDYQAANGEPGHLLTAVKLEVLHAAVLKSCGGLANGLASDPFVADPTACRFDPQTLICPGADAPNCLTAGEIKTAQAYYAGPSSHSGKPLYYGWAPGSEGPSPGGWTFTERGSNHEPAFDGLFKWVFGANWDWRNFDLERDMPKVDAELGASVNGATRGDLKAFHRQGGKLILYQGWADTLVTPAQTVAFYERQSRPFGGMAKTQSFARLFLAPGVMHCGQGRGPERLQRRQRPYRPATQNHAGRGYVRRAGALGRGRRCASSDRRHSLCR